MNKKYTKNLILSMVFTFLAVANIASAGPQPGPLVNPYITTDPNGAVTNTTCEFKGTVVTPNAGATVWFIYGKSMTKTQAPVLDQETTKISVNVGATSFTINATNLMPGNQYVYKAITEIKTLNKTTITASNTQTCSVPANPDAKLILSILPITNLNHESATLNGNMVIALETIENVKFIYGTSNMNMNNTESISGSYTSNTQVSKTISSLIPDTNYYYRLCATKVSNQTQYCTGVDTFKTDILPIVVGQAPNTNTDDEDHSRTTADLNGSFTATDFPVTAYFKWGTTSSVTNTVNVTGSFNSNDDFTYHLTGLSSGDTYYYQACAQNSYGTDCGDVESFKTSSSSGGGGSMSYDCNDGKDNDNDGFVDYPNDPACSSKYDDDESPYNPHVIVDPTPPIIKYVYVNNGNNITINTFMNLDLNASYTNVFEGDIVTYTINYGNISKYASLKNVSIEVKLGDDMSFVNSQSGIYNDQTRILRFDLGTLATREEGMLRFDLRVDKLSSALGLTTEAVGVYTINNNTDEVRDSVTLTGDFDSINNQTANALFAGAFLPQSVFGWFILIVLLAIIIFVARRLYSKPKTINH